MNKNSILRALASITLAAALGSLALHAQDAISVTVPFDFRVGSNPLPAGDYRVTQPVSGILAIRSVTDKSTTLVTTIPAEGGSSAAQAKLTFRQYGSYRFLRSVSSGDREWTMPKSPAERRLIATKASYQSLGILASKVR